MKIYHVIQIKLNQLVFKKNLHMIINLPEKRILSDNKVANTSNSFTHKMA